MRFADAGWTQEDDVFTPLDEAELVQTLHLLATERRLEGEIKLGEPLDGGQARLERIAACKRRLLRS